MQASFQLSEKEAGSSLEARLEQFTLLRARLPNTSDKWLLSSALQKSIRRGFAAQAVGIGLQLHRVDPTYLPRRLPVIALEDVSMGDPLICFDVLHCCGSIKWWREDPVRTLCYLVSGLANARKSRVACDLYCLSEASTVARSMMLAMRDASRELLVAIVKDCGQTLLDRVAALRLLGGAEIRGNAGKKRIRRRDAEAVGYLASVLQLPELVKVLATTKRDTHGLAPMLLLANELVAGASTTVRDASALNAPAVDGIPLCALDMYTALGRRAIKRWVSESDPLRMSSLGSRLRPELINLAVFQLEGCLLDRYIASPELLAITAQSDDAELAAFDFDARDAGDLRRLLKEHMPALNSVRQELVQRHFETFEAP